MTLGYLLLSHKDMTNIDILANLLSNTNSWSKLMLIMLSSCEAVFFYSENALIAKWNVHWMRVLYAFVIAADVVESFMHMGE